MRKLIVAALAALLAPCAARAQEQDLAALFPARTKGYLEITQVADVVKEIRGLLKGSCLEDPPGSMEKIMLGRHQNRWGMNMAGMFGSFFGPETFDEISRLKGGAIALLSTPRDFHQVPEFLGVLRTGDSNFAHISARAMIGLMDMMHTAETVEGVRIYRYRGFDDFPGNKFDFDKDPEPKKKDDSKDDKFQVQAIDKEEMNNEQFCIALLPGAIVIGSKSKEVGDLVRRLKGKKAGPTLADVPEFKKYAAQRQDPGMFLYAEFATLVAVGREILVPNFGGHGGKKPPPFEDKFDDKKFDDKQFEQVRFGGNPGKRRENDPWADLGASLSSSFKTIGLGLTLKSGTAELRGKINLDTGAQSAWNEFFSTRTLNFDLLNYVPKDSRLALGVALPEGMKFWDKLGKSAPVLETDLAALLTLIDIEKIQQVMLLDRQFVGDGIHRDFFNFVIEAKDVDTAKALGAAPLKGRVSVESKGRFAAFGQDRKGLAEILAAGSTKQGIGSDLKVTKALKEHQGAHALLVYSWGQKLADLARDDIRWLKEDLRRDKKAFEEEKKFKDEDKKQESEVAFAQGKDDIGPDGQRILKHMERIAKDFAKAVEDLPPFVFSITRKDDQLILLGRQTNLQGTMARIIDLVMEGDLSRGGRFNRGFDRFDRPVEPPKQEELKREVK